MLRQQASWGGNSLLSPHFSIGEVMRLFELFESKKAEKVTVKTPPPRNFVAKNAKTSGAGAHKTKQKKLKRDEKKLADE